MTARRSAGRHSGPEITGRNDDRVATDTGRAVDGGRGSRVTGRAVDGGRGSRAAAVGRAVRGDRGSFTAELAAGLPALMLLLLAGLTAVNAVTTKATCLDAAREAALAASRGGSGSAAGGRVAPPDSEIAVQVSGGQVTVTVRAPVRALGARLPRITVTGTVVAAVEPGTPVPLP